MEASEINPFSGAVDTDGGSTPFFRGGRRQELIQYIRHLSSNLYDVVLVVGPPGVGKSCMLQALRRQLADDLVDAACIDAKNDPEAEGAVALYRQLSEEGVPSSIEQRVSVGGSVTDGASDQGAMLSCRKGPEEAKPLICIDHVETWSEKTLAHFLSAWGVNPTDKQMPLLPIHSIFWVDSDWVDQIKKKPVGRLLLSRSYTVEVAPFNRVELQKYLEFKLSVGGASRFKFTKKEVDQILRRSKGIVRAVDKAAEVAFYRKIYRQFGWKQRLPKSHAAALICLMFALVWLGCTEQQERSMTMLEAPVFEGQILEGQIMGGQIGKDEEPSSLKWVVKLVDEPMEELAGEPIGQLLAEPVIEPLVEPVESPASGLIVEPVMVFISPEKGRELSPAESPAERARTPLEVRAVFYERLDHYTVQLMSGRDLKSIERRVRQLRSVVDVDVTYFETSRKDRPWYVLVAGTYTVHSDAESAAATLMVQAHSAWSKKVSKPWVRRVRGVIK